VEELAQWFKEAAFVDITETTVPGDDCGFSVTGCRPSERPELKVVQD